MKGRYHMVAVVSAADKKQLGIVRNKFKNSETKIDTPVNNKNTGKLYGYIVSWHSKKDEENHSVLNAAKKINGMSGVQVYFHMSNVPEGFSGFTSIWGSEASSISRLHVPDIELANIDE